MVDGMGITHIFSINTGRSGSDYLTELLAQATNTVSLHEGLPIMNGQPMRQFNNGDSDTLSQLMPLKMQEIQKKRKPGKIYCETNHSYIKGWGELIPDAYIPQESLGVIILNRDVQKTVHSLLRVHEAPGTSEWSRTWYLEPDASQNLSTPSDKADPYDLCAWYVDEIRLRAKAYQKRFPRITYFECNLEQLNDYEFVLKLFETFGLNPTSELKAVCGRPLNTRTEWPKVSLDEVLAPPKYPSADSLPQNERAMLVVKMIEYLHQYHADDITAAKPDLAMGGTLASASVRIVAHAVPELEIIFQYSLAFTETERILLRDFLRSHSPRDLMFIAVKPPQIAGEPSCYDFNSPIGIGSLVRQLGPAGLFKTVWMMANGLWGKDYTHREAK